MSEQQPQAIQEQEALWDTIKDEVEHAWGDVFKIVNTVLDHDERFGFKLIERSINPSFNDISLSLKMMEALLDVFPVDSGVDYSTSRMILNAKQQINLIEQVVTAIKYGKQDDYEQAMSKLRNQAQF